jgi:hypothetical protein
MGRRKRRETRGSCGESMGFSSRLALWPIPISRVNNAGEKAEVEVLGLGVVHHFFFTISGTKAVLNKIFW